MATPVAVGLFLWNLFSELYSEMTVASGHATAYPLEGYNTVLILETPFWVAGAAESMKISIIVIGASNKSGRH